MEFDSIERAIEGLKPRGSTVDGAAGEARKDDQKAEG
jgi:hypothetical protein